MRFIGIIEKNMELLYPEGLYIYMYIYISESLA